MVSAVAFTELEISETRQKYYMKGGLGTCVL